MSWKHICIAWKNEYANQGRPGSVGVLHYFFPEGRTYSPPASGRWYGLRPPCALRGGCGPCGGLPEMTAVIPGANGTGHRAALFHSPVKTCHRQLFTVYGGTQDEGRETKDGGMETGNLSLGGKGYQPGYRALRCCGSGLHELFSDIQ